MLEEELRVACDLTRRQQHKHAVLQAECGHMTREFLGNAQALEQEIDALRARAQVAEGGFRHHDAP